MSYQPKYNSYISTDNSSSTLLADAATFTGAWEDVAEYDSLTIAAKTDQNGVFYVDFSPDGVNVDSSLTRYYNITDIEAPHRFTLTRKYFRVRFTNDSGSAQTFLRLQTSVKAVAQNLNIPVDGTMSRDYDAISVRPTCFTSEVALGLRQGWETWNKFGYNTDIDLAAPEIIAAQGGSIAIMTTGATLDVVSSDANDTSAGTGARTIIITGIDENNIEQTEVVTLNGVTPVTTTGLWLGVNRATVISVGTGGENAGNITIDDTANTVGIQAYLPATTNVTAQSIFHIPINEKFLASWLWFNALKISGGGGSPRVDIYGYSYSRVTGATYEIFRGKIDTSVENTLEISSNEPFVLGGREVLYFVAETDVNNTEVICRFSGKLVKTPSAE